MKKIKKIKERILSIVLTCAMMATLLVGILPMEVHAEDGATLTYEVVGGTGSMASETLAADENFTLPEPSFTPDLNREFYGWIVYDENELLEKTGYINNTVLTVEAGENYKAIAYYGYRLTVQNLPNDTSIMYGSIMAKNPNPVVVPEFTESMMEGNAFMISNSSMTSAPSFTGENGSAELVQSSNGQYLYLVKDITGPVTLVASSTPPAGETVAVTLDKSNFSGELYYCINEAASFEPVVENTINITTNDFLALASFGVEYEVTASDNGVSIDKIPDDAGACIYKISGFTNATTLTINPVTPTTDTYDITLDRTNYAEGYVDLYTYDSEGSYVANTEDNNATITMPEGGKVRVFADSEFTVTAESATISEMLSAGDEGYYYEITCIAADTTVVVNKVTTQEQTYELTIDCEGFTEDAPLAVIRFDSDGYDIDAIEVANGDKVEIPVGGSVIVTAANEFTVVAEGATVGELQEGGEGGYYLVITNFTGDTTIVVNKGNTGSGDNVIDAVDVQVDWTKVPTLEKGMTEVPSMDQVPGTYTVNGASAYAASWAVKIDETYKITPEDSYYNELKAMESVEDSYGYIYTGEEFIEEYNEMLDNYIEVFSGMLPIQLILSNPYYAINEEDTYAMYIGFMADEGKTFGGSAGEAYKGTLTSNLDILCQFVDGNGEAIVVFFELGTLAEMEQEKDEAGGTPVVVAPAITSQPQNISVQEGQKATFSVTATGDNLSYQWQINRNDGNGFVNLSGATSASYTISTVDMDCNGFKYQCIVSNEGGSVTTNIATLTVTESSSVHTHSLTLVPAKAATCTTAGNKAYYTCSGCDSLFADANGTTITTAEAVKVAALDHDWTGEWTISKEATATEDGKKETLCTRGCGQKKVAIIPATGTSDDNGNLEKDAEVEPDAPIDDATLNNSKEELLEADNIFTDAEKTLIENGADARVWLEIGKTNESTIVSTDKEKVEQEAAKIMGDNVNITYFEADLFKQVGTTVTEIKEPGVAIKITIKIPDELLNSDKKVSREYKIVRLHEGQVDVLNGTFNSATGEFTFETDKFSSYAIVYKDVAVNNPTPGNNNVIKPENDKKDEVPKTGESNTALYSFVFMLVSGLGVVICSRKKRF